MINFILCQDLGVETSDFTSVSDLTADAHTYQVVASGSPTAITIRIEGSIDGIKWFELATHSFNADEITNQAAMFHIVGRVVPKVRAVGVTLTGGTTPTVTIHGTVS